MDKIIKIANIFFNLSVLFTKNFGRKIAVKKHIDVISICEKLVMLNMGI